MNIWQRFLQRQTHRQSRKLDKQQEQGFVQQWFLLAGKANDAAYPQPQQLNPIYPQMTVFGQTLFCGLKMAVILFFLKIFLMPHGAVLLASSK